MTDFNLDTFWAQERDEHLAVAQKTFSSSQDDFYRLVEVCTVSISEGSKIMFFGNGGSAADAQHLATELTVRFINDRPPIPALALTTDTSALTAIGNDYGFDDLFARQIEALGHEGDIAIGISTSGHSPNILKGLETARKKGLINVGLTGRDGGKMVDLCDLCLIVPSDVTARIQEMHITIGHMLCGALEKKLGFI